MIKVQWMNCLFILVSIHCDVDYCIIEVRSGSKCILLKFYVSINGMSTDNCALNSGLHSVMIIGLIMAIIVACVEKLHSPTLANTIIVAITVTIYTLGVILYMYLNDLTYDIISVVVAFVLAVPSVLFSFRVTRLSKKWKITIFSIMCALYAIMIAALIALKFAHKLATLVAVSCFCLMIIVIVLTPYFFKLYDLTKDYTLYYLLLVFLFEIVCSCSLMLFAFYTI
ncbi:hypothetical protein KSF78_0008014 [Schistosoma japonicum]|nr:hypothetical protein KSF78_0008014 [Schistosoma japonicum]